MVLTETENIFSGSPVFYSCPVHLYRLQARCTYPQQVRPGTIALRKHLFYPETAQEAAAVDLFQEMPGVVTGSQHDHDLVRVMYGLYLCGTAYRKEHKGQGTCKYN